MGPPVVQGAPVVPKMGVRARMSDLSQRRDAQEGLNSSFLSQPPHSNKSLDPQPRSETTFPVRPSPSTSRSLARMKRSNSEVTISDAGAEDPAAINPNTDASLRRNAISYKCFSHYDSQSVLFDFSSGFVPQADLQHRRNDSTSGCDVFDALSPDEREKNNFLVSSCPFFHNEIGGEMERRLGLTRANTSTCGAAADTSFSEPPLSTRRTNASISVLEFSGGTRAFDQNLMNNHDIEHIDLGARYYLKYFYNQGKSNHQNYFGIDENFGPVSLSLRLIQSCPLFQLSTLRGSITEDSIPSSSKHGTSRRLPLKDVLEFVVPQLSIHSLRLAADSPRVPELLLQLDQQEVSQFQRKVGVLFCRAGQSTEEDNSDSGSPALDQMVFDDSTGRQSVFTTFREFKLMFHVSTASSPQQVILLFDLVLCTVLYQRPGSLRFLPQNICSHSQHVFIIVRVHRPCSQHTCYSIAVSRRRDIPFFGPLIPPGWMFSASPEFRNFLLTKIINAENAAHRSETFVTIRARHRQEHLKELVESFSTSRGWEDSREIAQRLQLVTHGGPAVDMILRRNRHGQLGFHVNFEGVVADVETNSFAWKEGLRPGCRIMEICAVAIVTLSHKQMIELLRTSMTVSVVVILPHRDGTPRRSRDGLFELYFNGFRVKHNPMPGPRHHVSRIPGDLSLNQVCMILWALTDT
uniref:Signal-induced proliferation-associated 1 like 2 n=1 Tax=Neolamprologus brichardi TaxID=32507 RepID=A0A3Q4N7F4_NEOBR